MLRFQISNRRETQQFDHEAGPIEFGRGPKTNNVPRCVIQDLSVSRNHMRVEERAGGAVRVENLSEKNPIRLADNSTVAPLAGCEARLPVRLMLGETLVEVEAVALDPVRRDLLDTLAQPLRPLVTPPGSVSLLSLGEAPDAERLAHWFETVLAVQRAAAGSAEFYAQTAQALVDLVGLDKGLVLLRRGGRWEVAARVAAREVGFGRDFSTSILRFVEEERRTFYQAQATAPTASESLQGVEAVVASPVFGTGDEIVGVLYGSRNRFVKQRGSGIGRLEAQVVQVLASAVGAGLARQEREADAARLRVQFEQFVTPALARELERDPGLLEGKQREVTVLFSDIRGFSRLAERLAPTAPTDVCRLVAEVMDCLTEHVRRTEGVVVDYYGDGLCAMWNAPFDQPDHAARACRAALAVLAELPTLSGRWHDRLGGPLGVGVGINTGTALVGNTGSRHKLKYGPFGHTVNLASRVEGATKQVGVSVLMTDTTHVLVQDQFAVRRVCRARLAGMSDAVGLYELCAEEPEPEWAKERDAYEEALRLYEAADWSAACQSVYPVLAGREGHYDGPTLNLLSRAVECLKSPPASFSPVWEFPTK